MPGGESEAPDPRRWFVLAIVVASAFFVTLDNSVLTVAIPTILREFHTNLPSLQWVISGYALVFASLLIIGGRLGDLYGHRPTFMIGAAIFGAGSLLASVSSSVPELFVGEALIEGIGAALMLPATLALLSNNFRGHERAIAFGAWATVGGATVALAPFSGGYLTTYHSWRWAFRINVIVAPIVIVGTLLLVRRGDETGTRERLDVPGATLVALGMFLVVFGIIEGSTYGFITPVRDLTLLGVRWPSWSPVSIVPLAFALGLVTLAGFYALERVKERRRDDPLFEFGLLRHRRLRYGLLTALVLTMGQFGLFFVLAVVLQEGKGLSAVDTGLWLLPAGLFVVIGSQVGARLTRRFGVVRIVRIGMFVEALGLLYVALVVSVDVEFVTLVPGFVAYGLGLGFAAAQITNVAMSDVPHDKAGVAGGANSTVRQVGSALGIATLGSLLTTITIRNAIQKVRTSELASTVKTDAIERLHERGVNFSPPRGRSAASLGEIFRSAVSSGARPALLFAAGVVALGAVIARMIPEVDAATLRMDEGAVEAMTLTADLNIDVRSAVEPR